MSENKVINCEVVSPERIVYSGQAEMVVARGVEGEVGIMPMHIPFMTPLAIGELRILGGDKTEYVAVHGGYLEFNQNKCTVLADAAEIRHEIDIERAKQKKAEREREIEDAKLSEEALVAAEVSLKKALIRLRVAERKG